MYRIRPMQSEDYDDLIALLGTFAFGTFEGQWLVRLRDTLRRARLPFGGIYFLMGRKMAAGVTPLRAMPRLRPGLPAAALPGPTARQGQ